MTRYLKYFFVNRPTCFVNVGRLVALVFFLGLGSFAKAQGDQGEIEKVEVVIEKDRKISLPQAVRNFDKVPPRPAEPIKPEITYNFKNVNFTGSDYNPSIRPLKLKSETIDKIYGNYISAGYGNYASPYLEGYVTNKRDKNKFYGAKLYHQSYGSGPVEDKKSASAATELKLFGKAMSRRVVVGGSADFESRSAKFYGALPGLPVSDGSNQSYTTIGLAGDISNAKPTDFNYNLSAGVSYLKDDRSSNETVVSFGFKSNYKAGDDNLIKLESDYYLMSRNAGDISQTRHLFRVKPSYTFSPVENLTLQVGINAAFQNDTLGTIKSVNIYPHVAAQYELNSNLKAFTALTGDIDRVSLHSLSRENMWLDKGVAVNNTNRTFDFSGGLQGKLSGKIAFQTGIGLSNLNGLYSFENEVFTGFSTTKFAERFKVSYTDTKRTNFFAEVGYSSPKAFKILVRGDYFGYTSDRVWHRPTYKLNLVSSYNIVNKILLDADLFVQGGMKALALGAFDAGFGYEPPIITDIKPATDLNMKISYLFSDQFSVFIKGNNILNNQYQQYLYYPVRGLQVMAGLSWSF